MSHPTRLLVTAFLVIAPFMAHAVGTETPSTPTTTETTTECTDGQVWDEEKEECVDPQGAGLDDDTLFDAARELAFDGQFEHAITVLYQAQNRNDPRILNYLGYSHRHAGRIDVAMGYYHQALKIDPSYNLARSYMGQALALSGNLEAAEDQLLEIRARGGTGTWAEAALENALTDAGYVTTY